MAADNQYQTLDSMGRQLDEGLDSFSIVNIGSLDDAQLPTEDLLAVSQNLENLRFRGLPGPHMDVDDGHSTSNLTLSTRKADIPLERRHSEAAASSPGEVSLLEMLKESNENLILQLYEGNKKLKQILSEHRHLKKGLDQSRCSLKQVEKLKVRLESLKSKMRNRELEHCISVQELRSKVDRTEEVIDANVALRHHLQKLEQDMIKKDEEMARLREAVKDSEAKSATLEKKYAESEEVVGVLRAQLESYANDFQDENESRRHALEVIKQLDTQNLANRGAIESLENENRELKEKLAAVEDCGDFVTIHTSQKPSVEELKSNFNCPKCWKSFPEMKPLENHVEECLASDF